MKCTKDNPCGNCDAGYGGGCLAERRCFCGKLDRDHDDVNAGHVFGLSKIDTSLCQCCGHVFDKTALHFCHVPGMDARLCLSCSEFFWRVVQHFDEPKAAVDA